MFLRTDCFLSISSPSVCATLARIVPSGEPWGCGAACHGWEESSQAHRLCRQLSRREEPASSPSFIQAEGTRGETVLWRLDGAIPNSILKSGPGMARKAVPGWRTASHVRVNLHCFTASNSSLSVSMCPEVVDFPICLEGSTSPSRVWSVWL